MSKQIELDLDSIQKAILHIGGLVEDRVDKALTALLGRDAALAREVIDGDNVIDDLELEVEERCLDILALGGHIGDRPASVPVMLPVVAAHHPRSDAT
jgi:phosphate transport system protein